MPTRRQILVRAAGATALLTLNHSAFAAANPVQHATAITRVYGDGMRLVAIAVEYRDAVSAATLDKNACRVADRNIENLHVSDSPTGAPAASGRYLILELNPDDAAALLTVKKGRPANQKGDPAKNGPGKVGDKADSAPTLKPASAEIQTGSETVKTDSAINLVFDDFKQYEFADAATGKTVRYNLFIPKKTRGRQPLPAGAVHARRGRDRQHRHRPALPGQRCHRLGDAGSTKRQPLLRPRPRIRRNHR